MRKLTLDHRAAPAIGRLVLDLVKDLDGVVAVGGLTLGADPIATRSALLDRGLLVSAIPVTRAPDLRGPVLRVSTAAWVTEADLDALADALRAIG